MSTSLRSPRYQHLRELLISARRAAGLTQHEVAERLGRPQSFVAKYEGGERRLDVIEFIAVSEALGRHPLEIMKELVGQSQAL